MSEKELHTHGTDCACGHNHHHHDDGCGCGHDHDHEHPYGRVLVTTTPMKTLTKRPFCASLCRGFSSFCWARRWST